MNLCNRAYVWSQTHLYSKLENVVFGYQVGFIICEKFQDINKSCPQTFPVVLKTNPTFFLIAQTSVDDPNTTPIRKWDQNG